MSDVDNAIRKWWLHERPAIEAELRKMYNVGALEDRVLRLLYRAMRIAFIAGWNARCNQDVQQRTLFEDGD